MKYNRLLWIVGFIFILICAMVVLNSTAAPTPEFKMAKSIAMTGIPDEDGYLVVSKQAMEHGVKVIYMVGYFPKLETIGGCIATEEKLMSIAYHVKENSYSMQVIDMDTGSKLVSKELTEDEASFIMRNILKPFVNISIPI